MNIKKLRYPIVLRKYEILYQRLINKQAEIEYELAKQRKGYAGEVNFSYYLNLLAYKFTALQDVCLVINSQQTQIDNIVISPNAIHIIEVKNYIDIITFDHNLKQLILADGEKESGITYPISQVEIQAIKLKLWLREQGLPSIPIYYYVAISKPSTKIKVIGDQEEVARIVTHAEDIPSKILLNEESFSSTANFPHQKIGYAIKNASTEYNFDVMKRHEINYSDLVKGVICPDCKAIGITRVHGGWYCRRCQRKYRNAHISAINDYLLLVKPWIRNFECVDWLNINSRNVATRILRNAALTYDSEKGYWR
ncbi:NERD domain-containing protein [Oceanobacillus bengalensis]|uniref:NERD domain-containing protein n=2 Tax=Oceanobacillus bengalensis TaxID=1435466 RepID=A0A494YTL4_9BACI|nr:nuclease-related domain-containing protein [Oceanobacillus bengalensis]RKQ13473.1 NERD domain-containing protein [Oceanobacillus bengalensis]